jgi:tryptophan synthase beta chain
MTTGRFSSLTPSPRASTTQQSGRSTPTFASRGRIDYDFATDDEGTRRFQKLSRDRGDHPALESSHAIAHVLKVAPQMSPDEIILANLSGRGDKDVSQAAALLLK